MNKVMEFMNKMSPLQKALLNTAGCITYLLLLISTLSPLSLDIMPTGLVILMSFIFGFNILLTGTVAVTQWILFYKKDVKNENC